MTIALQRSTELMGWLGELSVRRSSSWHTTM